VPPPHTYTHTHTHTEHHCPSFLSACTWISTLIFRNPLLVRRKNTDVQPNIKRMFLYIQNKRDILFLPAINKKNIFNLPS
jgi:hypothetical protein